MHNSGDLYLPVVTNSGKESGNEVAPTPDNHSNDNSSETNANARNNGEINNGNNDGSSVAPELTPNSDNNESTSITSVNNEVMRSPHLSCSATKPNHFNLLRRLF